MNGRIYDPTLGRMLQADPFIQAPSNTQSYNRYSYVMNNPLGYTDPSGYFSLKDAFKIGAVIAISYVTYGAASGWAMGAAMNSSYFMGAYGLSGAAMAAGVAGSAAVGFAGGVSMAAFSGASFGDAIKVGATGAVMGAATAGVGAAFSQALTPALGPNLTQVIVGGTISELTGGKFVNGAATAAFMIVASHGAAYARQPTPEEVTYARMSDITYDLTERHVKAGVQVDDYTLTKLTIDDSGLKAALFVNGDSQVVAYAGTSASSWANWKANLAQAFGFQSAQYRAGIKYAASLDGNVHFTGHSLGGGIASAAAITTGRSATVFNAAGVHISTLNGVSVTNGSVVQFRSSFDVLRVANATAPVTVPGQQISLGAAGIHGMGGVCKTAGCYP